MSLTRIRDTAVEIIRNLPNRPTGLGGRMSAAALKTAFDQAAENIKNAVNQVIGELEGTGGAAEIGFRSSTGIPENNVQSAIENVQQQIAGVSQGAVANNSITSEKLVDDSVTGAKVAPGTLREDVSGSSVMTLLSTQATSATNKLNLHYVKSLGMVFVDGSIEIVPSAAGRQVSSFGFTSYEPAFSGYDANSIFTDDGRFSTVWLIRQNGTVKLVATANEIEAAEVGDTRTINVLGWYLCDGEGS